MSFLLEMCPTERLGSLCVEFRLTFPYFSCTLPPFKGNWKNQRVSLEKELCPRKQAQAEQWQEQNHHLHHHKLKPNAKGTRVLRGLTYEQLVLVDMYKLENLIGGKYFDPSVLREFGFEDMVNWLIRHPQWSKVFEWRWPTYTPVTYEFFA